MAEDNRKVVIELQNVKRYFQVGSETVKALRGVSFKTDSLKARPSLFYGIFREATPCAAFYYFQP